MLHRLDVRYLEGYDNLNSSLILRRVGSFSVHRLFIALSDSVMLDFLAVLAPCSTKPRSPLLFFFDDSILVGEPYYIYFRRTSFINYFKRKEGHRLLRQ